MRRAYKCQVAETKYIHSSTQETYFLSYSHNLWYPIQEMLAYIRGVLTYWWGINEDGPCNARCVRPVLEGHACHNNIWGKVPPITLCSSHFNLIPVQDYRKRHAYLGNQYSDRNNKAVSNLRIACSSLEL